MTFTRDTKIEAGFRFKGCTFGSDVLIEAGAVFNVIGGHIGDRTIIRSGARVEGNSVVLGRESYLDHGAWIGGGSCFDEGAFLNAGDWLHMGWNSQVNIARGVEIGHEAGIGIETKIFTHGAYLPVDFGFPAQWAPVKIGNRVWLPNAWVNPGVTIGDNVVVAARSLINSDLPSGCLAAGCPAKVLKENAYPSASRLEEVLGQLRGVSVREMERTTAIVCGETFFDIGCRIIEGPMTGATEAVRNQLRRNGIRFRYSPVDGMYRPWEEVAR
ncbi:MAG: hypothetical protein WCV62_05775 [Candidatus Peribacteraceae bacterium]